MRQTSAIGNVAGRFIDKNPPTQPTGTRIDSQFMNDVMDELLGIQDEMSIAQGPGSDRLVFASLMKMTKEYRLPVGAVIQSTVALTPTVFDVNNPETYEPVFDLQAGGTLDVANYPDYVPKLRSELVRVGATTSFTGSASASIITLDNNADNLAVLEALLEDQIFYGAYNRPITWDGSDHVITLINGVTREITVTGTPTAGAGSATFHPYRIVGSTTTARILAHDGLVLATGGASGRVTGLVTRDRMQGWQLGAVEDDTGSRTVWGRARTRDNTASQVGLAGSTSVIFSANAQGDSKKLYALDDGTNGTPRTGLTTRDRSQAVYRYAWVGRLLP